MREESGLLNNATADSGLRQATQHIAKNTLKPHIVLMTVAMKSVVVLRLTMSWEDYTEEAIEREGDCQRQG